MKILVLNCGSSSIKYQLITMQKNDVLAEGIAEKIGEEIALFTYKSEKYTQKKRKMVIEDHEQGLQLILRSLVDSTNGVLCNLDEIDAVGHRLVHAGEHYSDAVLITDHVVNVMRECISLAPLHNPANLKGIEAVKAAMPDCPQCGVFDTAFHQSMPAEAYLYALPLDFYHTHKIRRYGFHGTSHKYVSMKAAEFLGRDLTDLNIICCHLGNGASISAIKAGKSIDTSMGLTPLEGLMMGTRCGDLDPAIPIHMQQSLGLNVDDVNSILNKKSGMLGLSQISNDMREIEDEVLNNKNPKAIQALDVYCYRIKKYIGSYYAAMNGADLLIFTGGVGERMPILRKQVCRELDCLGIQLDDVENARFTDEIQVLSSPDSRVTILKIPTNEELMIALDTQKLISK
ncbi:MAG: acetate kinase [Candidatus Cloacimonadaceae bacterium]|nr:acetate kinase [Candidatus Cloacimonadota bacterium]MDY0127883.1 acetate kinase [Candidatus Cloacimonadaceae bacterium]MCB5255104.1 acetate kinase [Candidatus Cloacimonadota bacterium]MCK9178464.1 acetate kinase [Candidatus Cloacimonadota bacterium]MCK9242046.1 acetate kinase [Candidatus Cloacimonadota bacterium]